MKFFLRFILSAVVAVTCIGCNEEGSKHEWSILQVVEFRHRDEPLTDNPKVELYEEYCAVGFKSKSKKERIWVLMNPKYSPMLKKMPNEPLSVTTEEYDNLPATCRHDERIRNAIVQ